ncbi:hypothetical protein M8J77_001016 [Diaphorina citri]|nr:hypothetical protein M8J77_001016 [Diaphorina citri]
MGPDEPMIGPVRWLTSGSFPELTAAEVQLPIVPMFGKIGRLSYTEIYHIEQISYLSCHQPNNVIESLTVTFGCSIHSGAVSQPFSHVSLLKSGTYDHVSQLDLRAGLSKDLFVLHPFEF